MEGKEISLLHSLLHGPQPGGMPATCQAAPWNALAFTAAAREEPRKWRAGEESCLSVVIITGGGWNLQIWARAWATLIEFFVQATCVFLSSLESPFFLIFVVFKHPNHSTGAHSNLTLLQVCIGITSSLLNGPIVIRLNFLWDI